MLKCSQELRDAFYNALGDIVAHDLQAIYQMLRTFRKLICVIDGDMVLLSSLS